MKPSFAMALDECSRGAAEAEKIAQRVDELKPNIYQQQELVVSHSASHERRLRAGREAPLIPTLTENFQSFGMQAFRSIESLMSTANRGNSFAVDTTMSRNSGTAPERAGSREFDASVGRNERDSSSNPSERVAKGEEQGQSDLDTALASLDIESLMRQRKSNSHQHFNSGTKEVARGDSLNGQRASEGNRREPLPAEGSIPPVGTNGGWICEHGYRIDQCSFLEKHRTNIYNRLFSSSYENPAVKIF